MDPRSDASIDYILDGTQQILTGEPPFPAHTTYAQIYRAVVIAKEEPPPKPTTRCGRDFHLLWKIASQCWKAEPVDRLCMECASSLLGGSTHEPGQAIAPL